MKKYLLLLCYNLLFLGAIAQPQKEKLITFSKKITAQFLDKDYLAIFDKYDASVARFNSENGIESLAKDWETRFGKIIETKEPVLEFNSRGCISRNALVCEKGTIILSININPKLKIIGLYLNNQIGIYIMPDYVNDLSFREDKIAFGSEGWKLEGTLSYPNDNLKHAAVIIVHGSGPIDRDGAWDNSKIYRDLAWGLASNNISVFRYDKRSFTHGSKLYMETYQGKNYTAQDEIVDDVLSAIKTLKLNKHVDSNQIYIVGHGQGGMMLPLVAQQDSSIKGLILMAAYGRKLQDALIAQMNYLYPDSEQMTLNHFNQKKEILQQATFAKQKNIPANTPTDSLPFGVRASYWNFLNSYNQTQVFAQTKTPALILQGERDYQATMVDFDLWKKAAANRAAKTDFISYPKLNYYFITGEGPSKLIEYQKQGNVDVQVVSDITHWINAPK